MKPFRIETCDDCGDTAIIDHNAETLMITVNRAHEVLINDDAQIELLEKLAECHGFELTKKLIYWPDLEPGDVFYFQKEDDYSHRSDDMVITEVDGKKGYRFHYDPPSAMKQHIVVWFDGVERPIKKVES